MSNSQSVHLVQDVRGVLQAPGVPVDPAVRAPLLRLKLVQENQGVLGVLGDLAPPSVLERTDKRKSIWFS